jgi:hypothetical protein
MYNFCELAEILTEINRTDFKRLFQRTYGTTKNGRENLKGRFQTSPLKRLFIDSLLLRPFIGIVQKISSLIWSGNWEKTGLEKQTW